MAPKRRLLIALTLFLVFSVFATAALQVKADTAVFINEIHYDNTGADTGEAIEIAGPAGTDLTGWTLVPYNGSGGAPYSPTVNLSGSIPDIGGSGYGVLFFAVPGLQNGLPDGVALVDSTATVVQFLSYEGSFTAVGGPADGMTSVDIGVAESGSGAVGNSLQLTGSGATYEDFTWAGEAANTFGAANSGQTFVKPPPAEPKINEFSASTTGADVEYVEVIGDPDSDYALYTILEIEGDSESATGTIDEVIPLGTTGPGGLYLVNLPANALENGTITLLLVKEFSGSLGNDLDPDNDGALDATPWSAIVDAVAVNDGGAGDLTYGVPALGPNYDGVVSFAPGGASRFPDGVDTDTAADWVRNDFDLAGIPGFTGTIAAGEAYNTPGAPNAFFSAAPDLVISEIMQNPNAVSDNDGEWFEIYNAGTTAVDINGWTIKDDGTNSHVINNGGPLLVPVGGYLVLGNTTDTTANGGAPVAYGYGGAIQLGNTDDEVVLLDTNLVEVDRVAYDGGPVWPDPTGASMALSDLTLDNNDGANWCTSSTPFGAGDKGTPGAANDCNGGGGGPTAKFIHEIQGSGPAVTTTDPVIVEAIVVGDFQEDSQLRGFFIQEEDADVDADPATSEGIFVFCGSCDTAVAVGDKVTLTGVPTDFFSMSQIDVTGAGGLVNVVSSGNPLPTAAAVDLPAPGVTNDAATLENVEGMLVTFSDTLVVSEYFELARYGQLVLTAEARPQQFTDAFEPSVAGYAAFLADLGSRRIILDDDNNRQNDAIDFSDPSNDKPYYWPRPGLSISNRIRGGDSISGLTGVLHWSFAGQSGTDAWRVRPVEEAFTYAFDTDNPRPAAPEAVGGTLQVASFNVLNYFTTINSRGADSVAELDRQRAKIAEAICDIDADIVGLMEIENNGSVAIESLLDDSDGINANCGPYTYIDAGIFGTDEIAVALIYKPATVSPLGSFAILDSSVDPRFDDTRNRPALAQTFVENSSGGAMTVVVNHLKSKGSSCAPEDPDALDGQGNCNLTRAAAAAAMVDWLATDPTNSGDADALIIGDLNAYRNEDPIDAIEAGPDDIAGTGDDYTDLLDTLIGPSAYSYVFDGQLGYLDHALASSSLLGQVSGATVWHINADEIPVFDYNDDIKDGSNEQNFERESTALPIYEDNPYRASDHDPVVVGLDLNGPPVCSAAVPSREELWPVNHKFVPVSILGVTDPNGDTPLITITGIWQDELVSGSGSGNTAPDGLGVGTSTAKLRAERDGSGNGRAYHVYFSAADEQGLSCSGEVLVYVPKSKGKFGTRIDDGALYDSTLP